MGAGLHWYDQYFECFIWDTKVPFGPIKDLLNSYDLFLFLKSSNYESQWKYEFIMPWWRLYIYVMKNSSICLMLPTLNETDIKNENK